MLVAVILFTAYLLGSIPSAVWLGEWLYGVDIRQHGSRNSGATNTFRVLGKPLGFTVLLMDVSKGFLAVQASYWFLQEDKSYVLLDVFAGLCCILGHIYSVFVSFKGGKGVATSFGVYLALNPFTVFVCLAIFILVFFTTRYVSLASILAALSLPWISYFVFQQFEPITILFNAFITALVVFSHRKNIQRLINGSEPKMNFSKSKA
jgi:glycerol-3-phosphate acyltransferase PlsY